MIIASPILKLQLYWQLPAVCRADLFTEKPLEYQSPKIDIGLCILIGRMFFELGMAGQAIYPVLQATPLRNLKTCVCLTVIHYS